MHASIHGQDIYILHIMEYFASTTIIISFPIPAQVWVHAQEGADMTQYQIMHMENIMVVSDEWYNHYDDDEEDP